MLVTGLCMIAFSCGVMTTEAVERFWPRSRAGAAAGAAPAPAAETGFEVTRQPATPAARPAEVTPLPAADPNPADHAAPTPAAAAKPSAEAVSPEPAAVPAPSHAPAAATVAQSAPTVRVAPAQGRAAVRKRPTSHAGGAQAGDSLPPSSQSSVDGWADPFAQ